MIAVGSVRGNAWLCSQIRVGQLRPVLGGHITLAPAWVDIVFPPQDEQNRFRLFQSSRLLEWERIADDGWDNVRLIRLSL